MNRRGKLMDIFKRSLQVLTPLCLLIKEHIDVPGLYSFWVQSLGYQVSKLIFRVKELGNTWILEQGCCLIGATLIIRLKHVRPDDNYTDILVLHFFDDRFLNRFGPLQTPSAG